MIQLKTKYFMLVALILAFAGCDKLIYDQPDDGNGAKVYLSVNTRAAHTNGQESINEDEEDFEDRVHDLAMLVFDTGSGQKIAEYFGSNLGNGESTYVFTAELTPGQRDFYFVANMPDLKAELEGITTRGAMNTLMNTVRNLETDLYLNATEAKGFPMARVYPNQTVSQGGTLYQPLPFHPVVGADTEDNVKLIRVVAKLEVQFTIGSEATLGITEVKYHNAFRQFSLLPQASPLASPGYYTDAVLTPKAGTTHTYVYYMPEALVTSSTTWSGATDHKPVNYFSVTTTNGTTYEIPIISYGATSNDPNVAPTTIPGGNYLDFATGALAPANVPDYNIHRNRHYKYVVKNLQKIEIIYEIDPWNVVNKSTYMGYGYNVEVDEDGNITITNTIDDCMPHKVRLIAVGGAYFGTPGNYTVEYGFESETDTGYDEQKSKAGYSEDFQVNSSAVAAGQPYLEVYYNKVPGVGVMPDKVFTK